MSPQPQIFPVRWKMSGCCLKETTETVLKFKTGRGRMDFTDNNRQKLINKVSGVLVVDKPVE